MLRMCILRVFIHHNIPHPVSSCLLSYHHLCHFSPTPHQPSLSSSSLNHTTLSSFSSPPPATITFFSFSPSPPLHTLLFSHLLLFPPLPSPSTPSPLLTLPFMAIPRITCPPVSLGLAVRSRSEWSPSSYQLVAFCSTTSELLGSARETIPFTDLKALRLSRCTTGQMDTSPSMRLLGPGSSRD